MFRVETADIGSRGNQQLRKRKVFVPLAPPLTTFPAQSTNTGHSSRKKDDGASRVATLEAEIGHMVDAIGQGLLSPALRQRLHDAERELERAKAAPKPASIEEMLPRLPDMIRRQVRDIEMLAAVEPIRARAAVRQALEAEEIVLYPAKHGRGVVAHFGLVPETNFEVR